MRSSASLQAPTARSNSRQLKNTGLIALISLLFSAPLLAAGAIDGEVARQPTNVTAITMFLLFVAATLGISYWASKRTHSSKDFYTAGGQISGLQNGTAIAGDFMSAASFLGISGLMFSFGYDGLVFAIGAMAGWPVMLFLLANRIRNLGSCTFIDVVSQRLDRIRIRLVSILGSITVVILYLIAQMVGAGKLIQLLFGLPYEVAVGAVGVLVIAYVTFGGMLATTWVQIIKAILLLFGATLIAVLVMNEAGFSLDNLFAGAAAAHPLGEAVLSAGVLFNDPIQVTTILVSMLFGVLGLPHILMRLFTVPTMEAAQKSVLWASVFIGYFYVLLLIIGFGTIFILYQHPELFVDGKIIGGSNMVAIHLANVVGGELLMGFMSAVAFATILAVVAGLTVSGAASVSHDFYAGVICKDEPNPTVELRLTRITTVVICLIAILLGIVFQNQNVAFLAAMPMVVAATANFPVLAMSLFWSGTTTRGAVAGALVGLITSVGLTIVSPQVWVQALGFESALFPYNYPSLFTMPVTFIVIYLVSHLDRSARGVVDRDNFTLLLERSELGSSEPLDVSRH